MEQQPLCWSRKWYFQPQQTHEIMQMGWNNHLYGGHENGVTDSVKVLSFCTIDIIVWGNEFRF